MNETAPALLDVRQAAALLGISKNTLWTLHNQGRVPQPIRLSPRVVRWPADELKAWIVAGCPARGVWEQTKKKTA